MIVSKRSPNVAFGPTDAVLLRADSTEEFAVGQEQEGNRSEDQKRTEDSPAPKSKSKLVAVSR